MFIISKHTVKINIWHKNVKKILIRIYIYEEFQAEF